MSCTAEQQRIIDEFTSNPSPLTLIQGKAGTGKSYMIRELASKLPGTLILTPTNMAKSMYSNAQTMHSFFYGESDDLDEGYQNPNTYSPYKNSYQSYFADKLSRDTAFFAIKANHFLHGEPFFRKFAGIA